jgi:hypothetical protein
LKTSPARRVAGRFYTTAAAACTVSPFACTRVIDPLGAQNKLAVGLGVVAWNAALIPQPERERVIEQALDRLPELARHDLQEMLEALVDRKLRYFADEPRFIAGYQVSDLGSSRHVQVASLGGAS